jgi:hypothetical protein
VLAPVVFRQQFCGDAIEQPEPDADRNVSRTAPAALRALDQARAVFDIDDRWTVGAWHGPTSLLAPGTRKEKLPFVHPPGWDDFGSSLETVRSGVRSTAAGDHPHGAGMIFRQTLGGHPIREWHIDADRHRG